MLRVECVWLATMTSTLTWTLIYFRNLSRCFLGSLWTQIYQVSQSVFLSYREGSHLRTNSMPWGNFVANFCSRQWSQLHFSPCSNANQLFLWTQHPKTSYVYFSWSPLWYYLRFASILWLLCTFSVPRSMSLMNLLLGMKIYHWSKLGLPPWYLTKFHWTTAQSHTSPGVWDLGSCFYLCW